MKGIKQYVTYDKGLLTPEETADLAGFLKKYGMEGTECYMSEIKPATEPLFTSPEEKQTLVDELSALGVKRVHCSYWGYPTSFLTKSHYGELVERLGGPEQVIAYYGDLTGKHFYSRWLQEYELACALGAQAYVLNTIDYAAVDGPWEYTIDRQEILQAIIGMVQMLLLLLEEEGLLTETSPLLEMENAGWGLEYGLQTNLDFKEAFAQLYDPKDRIRIGWDINHLLHAIGYDGEKKQACFMLQDFEISPAMAELERNDGQDSKVFAMRWIESNVLDPVIMEKTNCLHLSDCELKDFEYFRNGRLQGKYGEAIDALPTNEEKGEYGYLLLLEKYDSHVPMGDGVLLAESMRRIIGALAEKNPEFVILHELKNSRPLTPDLEKQLAFLEE